MAIDDYLGEPVSFIPEEWEGISMDDLIDWYNNLPAEYWRKVNDWIANPYDDHERRID